MAGVIKLGSKLGFLRALNEELLWAGKGAYRHTGPSRVS